MPRHLNQISDLTRTEIDGIIARADAHSTHAEPQLNGRTIACSLFNTPFPLPVNVEDVLTSAGALVRNISVRDVSKLSELARACDEANAEVVLFSHPQAGFAQKIADAVRTPVLNAGDGANENPVRALIDAYTIRLLKGDLAPMRVAILGNLKFGAEAHSFARLLSQFGVRLSLVTPAALSMPYDLTDDMRAAGIEVEETNDLTTTLKKIDVLYLAKIDPIRVESKIYDKLKNFYTLTQATIADAKPGLVVIGEWDGADALLAPTRPVVARAARDVLIAVLDRAIGD